MSKTTRMKRYGQQPFKTVQQIKNVCNELHVGLHRYFKIISNFFFMAVCREKVSFMKTSRILAPDTNMAVNSLSLSHNSHTKHPSRQFTTRFID